MNIINHLIGEIEEVCEVGAAGIISARKGRLGAGITVRAQGIHHFVAHRGGHVDGHAEVDARVRASRHGGTDWSEREVGKELGSDRGGEFVFGRLPVVTPNEDL